MLKAEEAEEVRSAEEEAALRMPDFDAYDERIVDQLYEEQLKAQKLNDDDIDEKQEAAAYQAVEKKLKAMPETQYKTMVAKFDKEEEAEQLEAYVREDLLLNVIGVHPGRASSVEWDQAERGAKEKIAKMTPAQRDAEYKRLHAKHEKENAAALAEAQREAAARRASRTQEDVDAERATRNAAVAFGAVVIFFLIFGGIRGGILILLALGLAYRTASGSVSD
jgi:hypothetical protein